MDFWQQNKVFVVIAGLGLVALLVFWPSLFGLEPTIVRFHSGSYESTMVDLRNIEAKLTAFFPESGKGIPIRQALHDVEAANRTLDSNFEAVRAWATFVPRFPFRIPEHLQPENVRQRYVSHAYAYLRTGKLLWEELKLDDASDGVVFLGSTRNLTPRDTSFGMPEMSTPEAIKEPDTRIAQLALVHELGHLAIRLNVDEIGSIVPAPRYTWQVNGVAVADAYPVNVRIKCDVPTLLAFLHALEGAHGTVAKVTSVGAAGGADEAVKPLPPAKKPRPGAADDPEDPGAAVKPLEPKKPAAPDDEGPAAPKDIPTQKLIIHLPGSPSFLSPDAAMGTLKERFTIFRPDESNPQKPKFIANAIVTKVLDPGTSALAPGDVLDWRGLCFKLRNEADAKDPCPGKRIWPLLTPDARSAADEIVKGQPPDDARRSALLQALNDLLKKRDLHTAADFPSVASNEVAGLARLDRQKLSPDQVQRLNRLLLESSYPREIAKATIKLEAAVEPHSNISFTPEGKATANLVREKDLASTRFFFVRSMRAKAIPETMQKEKDGFPTAVTPPHLDVELSVAALTFLQIQAAQATPKQPGEAAGVTIKRGL